MSDSIQTFRFSLPEREIAMLRSEQVVDDNPLAIEVAKPLFDVGIRVVQLKEFTFRETSSSPANPPPPVPPEYAIPSHQWIVLIQGTLNIQFDDETTSLKPGQLIYTPPGTIVAPSPTPPPSASVIVVAVESMLPCRSRSSTVARTLGA